MPSAQIQDTTLKLLGKDHLKALAVKAFTEDYHVLLVCDIGICKRNPEWKTYPEALVEADLLTSEDIKKIEDEDLQLVVIPFHSLHIAEDVYRQIPHASHFVSVYVDGELYTGACD
ncbi:MAG: hypothetical protein SNJ70_02825 [Armatimonadota bacterium]